MTDNDDFVEVEVVEEEKSQKKPHKSMPKDILYGVTIGIFELIVGILLLFKPEEFTRGIIITLGVILVVVGIINIIDYFRTPVEIASEGRLLVSGLVFTIFGLFCACNSAWFISIFPSLTVLYGVVILLVGISALQDSVSLMRAKSKKWTLPLLLSVVAIVLASLIFANPFGSSEALWIFVAVSVIVEAVIEIVSTFVRHFKLKNNK